MESGSIVEYIDRQKILCAVVLEVKNQRLRLLTENNREVKLSTGRLLYKDKTRLNLSMGRDRMVDALRELASKRKALLTQVDIKDLWEILNTEQVWIDLETMTEFCFPDNPGGDHKSAVIRAFFDDRLYFKFNLDSFFPNSVQQVERLTAQRMEEARKKRLVELGGDWLKSLLNGTSPPDDVNEEDTQEFIKILISYYLFEKESKHYVLAKAMISNSGLEQTTGLFPLLVKLNVFDENENIDLLRFEIATEFDDTIRQSAEHLVTSHQDLLTDGVRQDLTSLSLMTIDGQSTLDFDDALSIEKVGEQYRLGIHIVDVGHFVRKDDSIDREALARGSSIYMPDQKISMLPTALAEGLCSLKAGELRPAISTMVNLSPSKEIIDYEILPSLINVKHQLTYYDVNLAADQDPDILILREIAQKFRRRRLDGGAVQITVPEVNVWLADDQSITVNKINRESPGRMLVSELMILANWLMAKFLIENGLSAIFRSQPEPRERLYKGDGGTLFQNWMQRRYLSRFVLDYKSGKHSGLGLDAYVTATSPIRKYFDLITQRQIRAVLDLEQPYTAEEIDGLIQMLKIQMSNVARIQYGRHRYWLLKYLEQHIGRKEEAIVLNKRRNNYQILLSEYMIECDLPLSSGPELKPEDLIQVTIQNVNARKDLFQVAIG
ncbi:MAG: RNB domain-containing ribonuclease [Deltaproteobacteria bacterium]|nr:RNB domain-containing ribonuclease [Deltaproteobacteria bacterium]